MTSLSESSRGEGAPFTALQPIYFFVKANVLLLSLWQQIDSTVVPASFLSKEMHQSNAEHCLSQICTFIIVNLFTLKKKVEQLAGR